MAKIIKDNIKTLPTTKKLNGWFIGHFIDEMPEFKTDDFEVKYSNDKKGKPDLNKKSPFPKLIRFIILIIQVILYSTTQKITTTFGKQQPISVPV